MKPPFLSRLAPTPSGYLHIGNIFSFAVATAVAKQFDARMWLRIDDLDRDRVRPAYLQDIFDTLQYLDIKWDVGPKDVQDFTAQHSQQKRLRNYHAALEQLRSKDMVFACSCSRGKLEQAGVESGCVDDCRDKKLPMDGDYAWRLRTVDTHALTVKNLFGEETVAKLPVSVREFVVRKKDGSPAYQLASLIDDTDAGVTMIVRGRDLWASTLAQLYLAEVLGLKKFGEVRFLHHALLQGHDGQKLSKSAGAGSVHYYRDKGMEKEEIFGMIGKTAGVGAVVSSALELGVAVMNKLQDSFDRR